MANLIPPDAKRAIIIEYWIRVVTVWAVLVGCGLLVVAVLRLPTFVLVRSQLEVFSNAYNQARIQEEVFEEAQHTISEANTLSNLLANSATTTSLSEIVTLLDDIAGVGVTISDFNFQKSDTDITQIDIRGLANTRTALADFSQNIEAHTLFDEAELPISNLAKDKDINFEITIIPASL